MLGAPTVGLRREGFDKGWGSFLELLFPIVAMQTETACSVLLGRYPRGKERQVGMANLKILLTPRQHVAPVK